MFRAIGHHGRVFARQMNRSPPFPSPSPSSSSSSSSSSSRSFGSAPFFKAAGSGVGKMFTRLGTAAVVGTTGGYGFFSALQSYFGTMPNFPRMNDWNLGVFQGKMEAIQDWLKANERRKAPRKEEEIEDELPSALKKMVKTTMAAPIPVPIPQRKGHFGDGDLMYITRRLIQVRSTLNSIADLRLQLPTIVVVGAQSSGKSSVLEAIVGHEFLPKGNNMVTRKPLELTLIHTPNSTEEYGEFPQLKITNLRDFNKIREYIQQMNQSVPEADHVSEEPIQLRIYSPHVPDLSLVDLPGYIRVTSDRQPVELKEKIITLCNKYIQEPNIILAISAADVDLANSDSIKESRKADPLGQRTLGVLTKMDQIRPADGADLLKHNDYRLGLGYIGVINKPPTAGAHFEDADKYFSNQAAFLDILDRTGVNNLRDKLVRILEEHMIKSLKSMAEKVKTELEETKYVLKVEYNDLRISQDYYIANMATTIKTQFYEFANNFGKPDIQNMVREKLESKILQTCEDLYWNDPSLRSPFDPKYNPTTNPSKSGAYENPNARNVPNFGPAQQAAYLGYSLQQAAGIITRSGIGKFTTQLMVQRMVDQAEKLTEGEIFRKQPEVRQKVIQIAKDILKTKDLHTSELIENIMKGYKSGIDITQAEWERGYYRTLDLIKQHIGATQKQLTELQQKHGKKNVDSAVAAIQTKHQKERQKKDLNDFTPVAAVDATGEPLSAVVEEQAREVMKLKSKLAILSLRLKYIKSNGWTREAAITTCPEIYLQVMVEQISKMSSMTLYSELWDDFAFHFPPRIDEHLYYKISAEEKKKIISNDPKVQRHLELLTKRDKLEMANEELTELLRAYNNLKSNKFPK